MTGLSSLSPRPFPSAIEILRGPIKGLARTSFNGGLLAFEETLGEGFAFRSGKVAAEEARASVILPVESDVCEARKATLWGIVGES